MSKVYRTWAGLIRAAEKDGFYPLHSSSDDFSISFYKTGYDTLLYIKEVGRWVKQ